ncbi:unnamed protein product [Peronospora destructor]|uniref:Exportin-1/Importin-beta-like domain-containing protein n=1 Tax=Peronospora destructor TaxID=86335 RepID=A0AAV0V7I4_9STRA|nr:unnamed protein product [Peronospora destructor]
MAGSPLLVVPKSLQALYALGTLSCNANCEESTRQQEANEFQNNFAVSDTAMECRAAANTGRDIGVTSRSSFFAANMLHNKARREWVRLSAEQKAGLKTSLQTVIQALQSGSRLEYHQGPLSPQALCYLRARGDAGELAFLWLSHAVFGRKWSEAELAFIAKDTVEMHLSVLSGDMVALTGKIILIREGQNTRVAALHGEAFACLNVASYPTPAYLEMTLLVASAQGLLKTRAYMQSAIGAEEEEVSHALTDVISTFSETYADWILEGVHPEKATALGELMLYLGSQPRRQIASLTLEFWMVIQDKPVASRLWFYQQDAFVHLFDVMLKQCSFPPGNAEDIDELEYDDLNAFRSGFQGVSDAFIAIFSLLKAEYLACLLPVLSAASSKWQNVEVALFAVSTVADEIKKMLSNTSAGALHQANLESMILQVLQAILVSTASAHPLVITTASRLLGQFAGWINKQALAARAFDTIEAVLQYLTGALGLESSCVNAAKSFMQVATSCTSCLIEMQPGFLVASVQHFGGVSGQKAMPIEGRLLVIEGIIRVAAVSMNCSAILQTVLNDSLSRLDQVLVATSSEDMVSSTLVCNELHVLGKVIRFLDAPDDAAGGKAVTAWAVQQIWSHLDPIAPQFEMDEAVMTALFELYGWCLQSVRDNMAPQLGGIATLIVKVFEERHFVAPLECASVAVDVFGKNANAEIVDSFRRLMGALSQSAFRFFTTHSLAESPEVLRSFFELAYCFLLFCPAAVLTAAEFPVLVELSLACLSNQDRASTNAVLMFLTFLLNESTNKLAPFTAVINAIVLDVGQTEKWLDSLIGALASKSPSALYESLSKLLYALLTGFTSNERVRATLMQSLACDALGIAELQPTDRQQVLLSWLSLAAEPSRYSERRFRGLCSDFAKVCRKELTADTLHSIELSNYNTK